MKISFAYILTEGERENSKGFIAKLRSYPNNLVLTHVCFEPFFTIQHVFPSLPTSGNVFTTLQLYRKLFSNIFWNPQYLTNFDQI